MGKPETSALNFLPDDERERIEKENAELVKSAKEPVFVNSNFDDGYVKFLITPTVLKMQQIDAGYLMIKIENGKVAFELQPANFSVPGIIYEDQLPEMTDEEYNEWFKTSFVLNGVRMGFERKAVKDDELMDIIESLENLKNAMDLEEVQEDLQKAIDFLEKL